MENKMQKTIGKEPAGKSTLKASTVERQRFSKEFKLAAVAALKAGATLFSCGNGGSAADALHFAEEFTGRYRGNRRPLPALMLGADAPSLTCIANDFRN